MGVAKRLIRWQWGSGMSTGASVEQDGVVWCPSCGIPHAVEATHCSLCSRPLAESDEDEADATPAEQEARTSALARAIAERAATQRSPRQRRAGPWTVPGLRKPLTDDEIEARAAAIVAQARKEEDDGTAVPLFTDGSRPLSDEEMLSQLEFLPPLRQRDREWLLAGLLCCVFLIIGAVAIVRFFAL
jgi:hypothetical protein